MGVSVSETDVSLVQPSSVDDVMKSVVVAALVGPSLVTASVVIVGSMSAGVVVKSSVVGVSVSKGLVVGKYSVVASLEIVVESSVGGNVGKSVSKVIVENSVVKS